MPFMGGMEATELIRAYEKQTGLSPTPIIALTAHASAYGTLGLHRVFLTGVFLFRSDWRQRTLSAGRNGEY